MTPQNHLSHVRLEESFRTCWSYFYHRNSCRKRSTGQITRVGPGLPYRQIISILSRTLIPHSIFWKGYTISPFLFSHLVEHLVQLSFQAGTKLFAYTDNLQLVFTGQHRYTHIEHALDIISRECNWIRLRINPTKSSAIYTSGDPLNLP